MKLLLWSSLAAKFLFASVIYVLVAPVALAEMYWGFFFQFNSSRWLLKGHATLCIEGLKPLVVQLACISGLWHCANYVQLSQQNHLAQSYLQLCGMWDPFTFPYATNKRAPMTCIFAYCMCLLFGRCERVLHNTGQTQSHVVHWHYCPFDQLTCPVMQENLKVSILFLCRFAVWCLMFVWILLPGLACVCWLELQSFSG